MLSTVSKATDSDANVYLCVVPVRVKYEEKEILTYAFLDQGSTHTFCDKTLTQSLGITGRSKKICLQTLAGSVKGYDGISCELEVSGLDGEVYYTISNVFSIDEIPVRPNLVPMQRKILKLPHLKGIKLDTLSNVEVGLLIGVDVPELFCTSEFRKGHVVLCQLFIHLWASLCSGLLYHHLILRIARFTFHVRQMTQLINL